MSGTSAASGWRGFWERGGWWRAIVLVVGYFVLYNGLSLLLAPLTDVGIEPRSALWVLVFYAVPILIGGLVLLVFTVSVGWLPAVFGPQPVRGSGWMWIGIAVVLLFNVMHLLAVDYADAGVEIVATWLLTGLLIGFAEEVLTRGLVVRLLRTAGYREIAVVSISSALFAVLHSGNLLTGQSVVATGIQLVYTFGFGVCMYLAMRVTGTILAPILLHASTDPSIFLQAQYPGAGALGSIADLGNVAVILVGVIAVFLIRTPDETGDGLGRVRVDGR